MLSAASVSGLMVVSKTSTNTHDELLLNKFQLSLDLEESYYR